jgi:hypothetical protein
MDHRLHYRTYLSNFSTYVLYTNGLRDTPFISKSFDDNIL